MSLLISGVIACVCYVAATVMQVRSILKGTAFNRWVKVLGGLAVLFHGITNYQDFLGAGGIDLTIYPMLSLMALSIVAIVLFSSLRRPVDNLFIVIFPLALATVVAEILLHEDYTASNEVTRGILGHIILSIIAYSLLTIAAAQAVLLSLGDSLFRNHHLAIVRNMPPLETMEQLMFEMLAWGLIFLTLSIATGFFFLEDISGPGLMHHTVITMAAWIVFSVLMWGRYQLGWRGAIASRWTLSGFVLLVLGYFGSKVVLEIILGRV